MLHRNLDLTLITGPQGSGKSLLAEILSGLANNGGFINTDTSSILDLHMEKETPIGIELLKLRQDREEGKILPDELVFTAIKQWIDAKMEHQNLHHVVIAGSPRSLGQSELWLRHSDDIKVVHVRAQFAESIAGIKKRQSDAGKTRVDEKPEAINNRQVEYNQKVLPGLAVFNGHLLNIERSLPMRTRLVKTIGHINLPHQVRRRMLCRLETPTHPICIQVDALDGTKTH